MSQKSARINYNHVVVTSMEPLITSKFSFAFIAGTVLIVVSSFVIGFFNVAVLYWFGIPILALLIGISMVWFSKNGIKAKAVSTSLLVPIIPTSFFLFYLILPKAEPETFLIPQNFRGQLVVKFSEPCGQSGTYENGRRVYQIPLDGVLITRLPQTLGVIDREFFLDQGGDVTLIPEFHWTSLKEEKGEWHWLFSGQELTEESIGVFWAYEREFSFIVADFRTYGVEFAKTDFEKRVLFHKRFETKLNLCRHQINN